MYKGRASIIILCGLLALMLMMCVGKDENPYTDTSKAAIVISPAHFFSGDTVSIFQTFTFSINVKLPDAVEQISIHADNNRYWKTTDTILRPKDIASFPINMKVSFIDTGWNTITATALTTEGDTLISQTHSIYSYSPLDPEDVVSSYGEEVTFKTTPVPDPVDYYIWKLSDSYYPIIVDACSTKYITQNTSTFIQGEVYVKSGTAVSPSSPFTISLQDRTPPVIVCVNDSVSDDGYHVYTGRSLFNLRIKVTDNHSAIDAVTIDGGPFDRMDQASHLYVKEFRKLDTLTDAIPAVVSAADELGNSASVKLWVHYSDDIISTDTPYVDITVPSGDTAVTNDSKITVIGTIENCYEYDTLYLYLNKNGTLSSGYEKLDGPTFAWTWSVQLSQTENHCKFLAFRSPSLLTDTIAQASLFVNHDPDASDDIPPVIHSIKIGDTLIDGKFYTENKKPRLMVTAYDNESGIQSVTINGLPAINDGESIEYYSDVTLAHLLNGNQIIIIAQDNNENTAKDSVILYYNRPPRLAEKPGLQLLRVGETYTQNIEIIDDDGDSVTASATIVAPSGNNVIPITARSFSWTPTINDTGALTQITIQLSDGYKSVDGATYNASVSHTQPSSDSARFITNGNNFPDTLRARRDTLRITLKIDKPLDQGKYIFNAVIQNGATLLDNTLDSTIIWTPGAADTGTKNVRITVTSENGFIDTITPTIRILDPLPPITAGFAVASKTNPESVPACTVGVSLSRSSSANVSISYSVHSSKTTADSLDFTLPDPMVLTFDAGQTTRSIIIPIINDTIVEQDEDLVLRLDVPSGDIGSGSITEFLYTITNDDTAAASNDTIQFGKLSDSGPECACTVQVPIVLSQPANSQVYTFLSTSGTAYKDIDYKLLTTDITFNTGDSVQYAKIVIIDDNICEEAETIQLQLTNTSGATVGKDSTYIYTIESSDSDQCKKSVAIIVDPPNRQAINTLIKDSLIGMGYEAEIYTQNKIQNVIDAKPDVIFLSQTMHESVGEKLKGIAIPVICAYSEDLVPLGLAKKDSVFGIETSKMLIVNQFLIDKGLFPSQTVELTQYAEPFSWFRPSPNATVIGIQPPSGLIGSAKQRVLVAIYGSGKILFNNEVAPARRVAFCMAHNRLQNARKIRYHDHWWLLLKYSIDWCTGKY